MKIRFSSASSASSLLHLQDLKYIQKLETCKLPFFFFRGNFRKSKQTLTRVNILNKSSVEAFNDVQICGTANESSFFGLVLGLGVLFRALGTFSAVTLHSSFCFPYTRFA